MENILKQIFPNFSNELLSAIEENASAQNFEAGTILMRTGQYIKNTVLIVEGKIKIYREGEDGGEFLMYYLPATALAPIAVEILFCRGSAQKIGTYSGKSS